MEKFKAKGLLQEMVTLDLFMEKIWLYLEVIDITCLLMICLL